MRLLGARAPVLLLAVMACTGADRRAAAPVATDRVNLPKSYRFAPAAITVPAGTAVAWTNSDDFTHSVRLLDDGGRTLILKPGDSVRSTFTTPGLHRYDCSFHPRDMTGTVTVTATP